MNRRDALTAVALASVAAAASLEPAGADTASGGSTLERIKRTGTLRVAVIVGQEPYFHKDLQTGTWSGACIDMANDIASKPCRSRPPSMPRTTPPIQPDSSKCDR